MITGTIYKATDLSNGKIYVGQTIKTLEHRRHEHEGHKFNRPFYNALRKRK